MSEFATLQEPRILFNDRPKPADRLFRCLYLGITARRRSVDCGDNLRDMPLDYAPSPVANDNKSDLAPCQVLLVTEIAVRSHQHFKACGFGNGEEFAVVQFFPSARADLGNGVVIDQVT